MNNIDNILEIPLLSQKWKWLAIILLISPIAWVSLEIMQVISLGFIGLKEVVFASWSIAMAVLNNTRLKEEDEMTKQMRLIAFQRGVYFLISGISAIVIMQFIRHGNLGSNFLSVFEAVFLLMVYINITFEYLRWKSRQDAE